MYIGIGGCIFGKGPRPIGGPQIPLCGGGGLKSLGPGPSHGPLRGAPEGGMRIPGPGGWGRPWVGSWEVGEA